MRTVLAILMVWSAWACAEGEPRADGGLIPPDDMEERAVPKGDRVVLRSGRSLQGVHVLSESSIDVRVEVLPGRAPLILPAGQVIKVIYEPVESTGADREVGGDSPNDEPAQVLLPARKMSPEFSKKLAEEMVDQRRVYTNHDVVALLDGIASEHDIRIRIGPAIQAMPLEQRQVTLSVSPAQSIEAFLRRHLTKAAPWIRVETQFDEVTIALRPEGLLKK